MTVVLQYFTIQYFTIKRFRFFGLYAVSYLVIVLCCSSCASGQSTTTTTLSVQESVLQEFAFGLPEYPQQTAPKHTLWATQYYVYYAEVTTANGHALLDMQGNSFGAMLTDKDWCFGGVEGTILVKDSTGKLTTYNYAGRGKELQVDCSKFFSGSLIKPEAIGRSRYMIAHGAFGDGVQGLILAPFRTIAVDTNVFPIGTVMYIPAARGVLLTLPSGKIVQHDGYFFAGDIGGAIKGNHIDIFTGVFRKNPFPTFLHSKASMTFDAFVVDHTHISHLLRQLHTPAP